MSINMKYEGLVPVYDFDGSTIFVPPSNAGIVTGTEAWVDSSIRGITLGAWVKMDSLIASVSYKKTIISKMGQAANNEFGYLLDIDYPATARFYISSDGGGTNIDVVEVDSITLSIATWYLIIGRWNTSTISLFLDNTEFYETSGESDIHDTPSQMVFGGRHYDPTNLFFFDGLIAYPFICACSLSDAMITQIWRRTRHLFGK